MSTIPQAVRTVKRPILPPDDDDGSTDAAWPERLAESRAPVRMRAGSVTDYLITDTLARWIAQHRT